MNEPGSEQHVALVSPWLQPIQHPKANERNALLQTLPTSEQHSLQSRQGGNRYWNAVLLPAGDGVFLVDLNWAEDGFQRIQTLVCPANPPGVHGMHSYENLILALTLVAPPNHDAEPRGEPLQVEAIAVGLDAGHGCREEVLVRTFDGQWHACTQGVNVSDVGEVKLLLDLKKTDTLDQYLADRAKRQKRADAA